MWNADDGAKLAELDANPGTIDQQLAYSQKRITELTTNLPKLEEGVKAVSKEMADARTKLDAANKAAADAAGKKGELDKKIAGLNNQIKSLAEQEKPAKDALTARQADAKKKTDAFNAANQVRTAAQNEVNKWTGEFAKADAAAKAAAGDPAAAKNADRSQGQARRRQQATRRCQRQAEAFPGRKGRRRCRGEKGRRRLRREDPKP